MVENRTGTVFFLNKEFMKYYNILIVISQESLGNYYEKGRGFYKSFL